MPERYSPLPAQGPGTISPPQLQQQFTPAQSSDLDREFALTEPAMAKVDPNSQTPSAKNALMFWQRAKATRAQDPKTAALLAQKARLFAQDATGTSGPLRSIIGPLPQPGGDLSISQR